MKRIRIALVLVLAVLCGHSDVFGCTSMIASGKATASGRPFIWKHRDTSAKNNFLYRVEPKKEGEFGYVGLFNGNDSLITEEAWMGMNDAGFIVINTVAYNLPENKPDWIDKEGVVMARALEVCRTVDDFANLLDSLPKPLGVMTNFGVLDADGNGAYFETDDYKYVRFDLSDSPDGVMIRTNYAYSGTPDEGMGYIRHRNVEHLLGEQIEQGTLTPQSCTELVARSFYNDLLGYDACARPGEHIVVDQDFVPRHSSTASIVVEGLKPGEEADAMRMWANLGYPPCSHVVKVTLDEIPAEAGPTSDKGAYSPMGLEATERMNIVFPVKRGSGQRYVDLDAVKVISEQQHKISIENYNR
ncbi:MAG: C45 family peptidase [Muribaculaceae bacterium]|nr:C45 family peptidase [Muribaculaceae bacterium]